MRYVIKSWDWVKMSGTGELPVIEWGENAPEIQESDLYAVAIKLKSSKVGSVSSLLMKSGEMLDCVIGQYYEINIEIDKNSTLVLACFLSNDRLVLVMADDLHGSPAASTLTYGGEELLSMVNGLLSVKSLNQISENLSYFNDKKIYKFIKRREKFSWGIIFFTSLGVFALLATFFITYLRG